MANDAPTKERTEAKPSPNRRRLLEQSGAAGAVTWSCAPSGLIVAPQPAWMAFTGQTAEEMLGEGWTRVVHPEDRAPMLLSWREALARAEPYSAEIRVRRYDGQWRWMSVRAAPVRDVGGEIVEWCGVNIDVTDRRRAENALRESEERLRRVSDNAGVGLTRLDRHGIFLSANPAYEKISGKSLDQIIGRPIAEVISAAAAENLRPNIERVLRGEHVTFEAKLRYDGAGDRFVQLSYTPDTDAEGQIVGWVTCITDITERKQAESTLREREE